VSVLLVAAGLTAQAQDCTGISQALGSTLTTVRLVEGLDRPVLVASPPGEPDRLFIVEQVGTIRIFEDGALHPTTFLDIQAITRAPGDSGAGNEEGLLGLAFHPDYAVNGHFFVYHTDATGDNNLVARYTRASADKADDSTRQVVLAIPHPTYSNHNGGMIAFGPDDGYLYIGTGDGGSGCDPFNAAQDDLDLRGKLLRVDVNDPPYAIPPDNPFDSPTDNILDEIWAKGLRNPWRFSFDSLNADLYIGDVGQSSWEEINHRPGSSPGGENYGWDLYEGDHCPNPSCSGGGSCSLAGYVAPVHEYDRSGGACAVTGGRVYRGCRMPDLHGTYFYSDYCADFVRSFRVVGGVATDHQLRTGELDPGGSFELGEMVAFGADGRGEMYIVDLGRFASEGGEIYKIVPILPNLQVSGAGATPFLPGIAGNDWGWEDLAATSSHPIDSYRVYRSDAGGGGTFDCVHQAAATTWGLGDLDVPAAPGNFFSYLVTAVNAAGDETSPGESSFGTPRALSALPCPP
jgi:glucose/arabinose dehydrogenase